VILKNYTLEVIANGDQVLQFVPPQIFKDLTRTALHDALFTSSSYNIRVARSVIDARNTGHLCNLFLCMLALHRTVVLSVSHRCITDPPECRLLTSVNWTSEHMHDTLAMRCHHVAKAFGKRTNQFISQGAYASHVSLPCARNFRDTNGALIRSRWPRHGWLRPLCGV
jgi:hypothetical protein